MCVFCQNELLVSIIGCIKDVLKLIVPAVLPANLGTVLVCVSVCGRLVLNISAVHLHYFKSLCLNDS